MKTYKIDKENESLFNYQYLENIVDNNEVVFIYIYNDALKENFNYILNKNIDFVSKMYNPQVLLLLNTTQVIHKEVNNIFKKNIKLPTIIVFKDKNIVELLEDVVLFERS